MGVKGERERSIVNPFARRGRTIRMCSLNARGKGLTLQPAGSRREMKLCCEGAMSSHVEG